MSKHEIIRLLFRSISGASSAGEEQRLQEWIERSEENRLLYERVCRSEFLYQAATTDDSADRRTDWSRLEARVFRQTIRRRRMLRVAAAIAIPVLAGLSALFFNNRPEENSPSLLSDIVPGSAKVTVILNTGEEYVFKDNDTTVIAGSGTFSVADHVMSFTPGEADATAFTTLRVPRGGEYTVRLEDGTVVYMNAGSELRMPVRFTGSERSVHFEGEGYFDVEPDPARPFTVITARARVNVLGTEFNIRAYSDDTETVTTLVEGAVSVVSPQNECVSITPGMQAVVGRDHSLTTSRVEVYPFVAWKSGRIVFNDKRVEEVMKVFERWYDCEIFYSDEEIKERLITMDIRKYGDITEILELMKTVNKVNYTIHERRVYLSYNN